MAISSIFSNVVIRDLKQVEDFMDALEKSSKDPQREPTARENPQIRDKEAIRSLFARRLNDK